MPEKLQVEEKVIEMLKTVYDPEIPVNVYDLGLIYKIDLADDYALSVDMTLTAPNCPAADFIVEDVRQKLESIEQVRSVEVNLVFEPEWDKDMMTEEAKMELGVFRMPIWDAVPSRTTVRGNAGWCAFWTASRIRLRRFTCWGTSLISGMNIRRWCPVAIPVSSGSSANWPTGEWRYTSLRATTTSGAAITW